PSNRPMTLNVVFSAFGAASCSGANRERCSRWTAVHEFGHAIGFEHEQDRGDHVPAMQACYNALNTGASGHQTLGPWDIDSIMNYSNTPNYNPTGKLQNYTHPGRLSPGDIMGVQLAYGRKQGGSLVAVERGRCVGSDSSNNGSPALLRGCNPYN